MWGLNKSDRRRFKRRRVNARPRLYRVNARLAEQKKERRHRIGALVLFLAVVSGVAWLVLMGVQTFGQMLFWGNDQYRIRQFDFSSDGILSPAHIREYVQLREGKNLFAVDLKQIRRDLESVPVVRTAEVRRVLPDTLHVRVSERVPLARIGVMNDQYFLAVDHDGHLFGPGARTSQLPVITGYHEAGLRSGRVIHDDRFLDALRVLDLCEQRAIGREVRIRSIDVRHMEYLELILADGAEVRLARKNMEPQLARLVDILRDSRDKGRVARLINLTGERNVPVVFH